MAGTEEATDFQGEQPIPAVSRKARRGRRPKPDAKSAQINIRLDPGLKSAGDVVLSRLGITSSDAVRSLYEYLAREQSLPVGLSQQADSVPEESWAYQCEGLAWKLYYRVTDELAQEKGGC